MYRPGIGEQVTYAGHPLYLFDPPRNPLFPPGVGFIETVSALPPWHGLWNLVSTDGHFAPGTATIETETLPGGTTAIAAEELPNFLHGGAAVSVYTYSRDHRGDIDCTGRCAGTWIPVLTSGTPQVAGAVKAADVGTLRRVDGTRQVTYEGKPLYLYSAEQLLMANPFAPQVTGTAGNGDGLRGPHGGTFSIVSP